MLIVNFILRVRDGLPEEWETSAIWGNIVYVRSWRRFHSKITGHQLHMQLVGCMEQRQCLSEQQCVDVAGTPAACATAQLHRAVSI